MSKSRWLFIIFSVLLFFILIPPFQIPDEPSHFEYAFWLANGVYPKLPQKDQKLDKMFVRSLIQLYQVEGFHKDNRVMLDFPLINKTIINFSKIHGIKLINYKSENLQSYHPPIYYLLCALIIAFVQFIGLGTFVQIYILRLLSVGIYLLTVYIVEKTLCLLIKQKQVCHNLLLVFALNPLIIQIGIGINNDILLLFFSTLAIYILMKVIKEQNFYLKYWIMLAFVSSISILTKLNGVFIVPVILLTTYLKNGLSKLWVKKLLVLGSIIGITLSSWLIINQIRYGQLIVNNFALDESKKILSLSFFPAVINVLLEFRHAIMHYAGFIGWYQVYPFKEWFFPNTIFIIGFAIIGISHYIKKRDRLYDIFLISILSLTALLFLINLKHKLMGYDWDIQGRYLAPIFLAIILMVFKGVVKITNLEPNLVARFWMFSAIFQYYFVLFFVLIPRYYV